MEGCTILVKKQISLGRRKLEGGHERKKEVQNRADKETASEKFPDKGSANGIFTPRPAQLVTVRSCNGATLIHCLPSNFLMCSLYRTGLGWWFGGKVKVRGMCFQSLYWVGKREHSHET